jgi:protein TonB
VAVTADNWRGAHTGDRAVPLAIAFGVSLVCHLALLVALRGLRMESQGLPPLVVTMLARGGGEGDAPRSTASSEAPASAGVEAAPRPASVAAPVPVAPANVKRVARTREAAPRPVPAKPAAPATVDTAPMANAAPSTAGAISGAAAASVGNAGAGSGVDGTAANASGRGSESGGGAGGGADGLRALCASCPAPEYPARARRQGWQGTVDVELAIASDGSVRDARVGRSSGYPALDDVALDVARRSRFAVPDGGRELRGQLRYRFVLDATAARR